MSARIGARSGGSDQSTEPFRLNEEPRFRLLVSKSSKSMHQPQPKRRLIRGRAHSSVEGSSQFIIPRVNEAFSRPTAAAFPGRRRASPSQSGQAARRFEQ